MSKELLTVLKNTTRPDYGRLSKRFDTTAAKVRELDLTVGKRYFQSKDGKGRRELRKYIIAIRHVDKLWKREDMAEISKHQVKYDQGEVELVQARDGFNIIQYSIPRKVVNKPRPYFTYQEGKY
ncbi:hypothetical protein [Kiloniella sp.]|uniref:hypothetical protein n=1 Tax=Kiloniella sp. TaxID=1938587 RepID=UPI003B02E30E